jgi:replicative DNA helicase
MNKMMDKDNIKKKILKPVPLLDGIEEIRQDFEERIEQGDTTYGLEILDDCVETIRKGSITFIIASPNTGKSLLGQTIACNLAKQDKKVMVCSCEMGAGLLMERQLKTILGIRMSDIRQLYNSRRDEANNLLDAVYNKEYSYLRNIDICETGGATVYDIIDMLNSFPEFEYIVIDYIQRIKGFGSEYENITLAARELQTYARESGKRIIICSQANRSSTSEAKGDSKNNPDGMKVRGKGSGSIEEDGDVGISLLELYENGIKKILVTLFKNRYGDKKNVTYKYRLNDRLQFTLEGRDIV